MDHPHVKYVNLLMGFDFKSPAALQARIFEKVFEVAEISRFSPTEREAYEQRLKYYRDIKNVVDTSREEGMEKGMEKGIEKGRQAASASIARSLVGRGMDLDEISEVTGLSTAQLRRLLDE